MTAYFVLLLAAFSRVFPHALHGVGVNFTAVGGGLLFFGARRSPRHALAAVAILAATDVYLTRCVFGLPFHLQSYLLTWAWYAGVSLYGTFWLRRVSALRVVAGVLVSASSFFLLSNFAVWAADGLYPPTVAGIVTCFSLALPFFRNDLISTALTSAMLFGLPVLAGRLVQEWRAAMDADGLLG